VSRRIASALRQGAERQAAAVVEGSEEARRYPEDQLWETSEDPQGQGGI